MEEVARLEWNRRNALRRGEAERKRVEEAERKRVAEEVAGEEAYRQMLVGRGKTLEWVIREGEDVIGDFMRDESYDLYEAK